MSDLSARLRAAAAEIDGPALEQPPPGPLTCACSRASNGQAQVCEHMRARLVGVAGEDPMAALLRQAARAVEASPVRFTMSELKRRRYRLERRLAHLQRRCEGQGSRSSTYDTAEASALQTALVLMDDAIEQGRARRDIKPENEPPRRDLHVLAARMCLEHIGTDDARGFVVVYVRRAPDDDSECSIATCFGVEPVAIDDLREGSDGWFGLGDILPPGEILEVLCRVMKDGAGYDACTYLEVVKLVDGSPAIEVCA